ncbi:polysaccharide biosynthesis protein [Halobacillus salinus]|uniref:Polysaccharide biosynthesis protein n=2 Tax=Halobacillus salinus TaxID=192814 RepID=A0A4Z0GVI3_9BACI|nr:polysaccharide biosynthesis protein [Halobacillus salinus]
MVVPSTESAEALAPNDISSTIRRPNHQEKVETHIMTRRQLIRSTLVLSLAALISKALGAFFRIPLQNIAGDEVLGLFNMVYPFYMIALFLSVAGIPVALSKLIAESRQNKDSEQIRDLFHTARMIAIVFGILSWLTLFLLSGPLSKLFGEPDAKLSIMIVSFTLLLAPFMAVYRGYYQGFEDMTPTGVSQVLEQTARVFLSLGVAYVLVQMNAGYETVTAGVMAGTIIGVLVSFFYLWSKKQAPDFSIRRLPFKKLRHQSRTILAISLPIAFGSLTLALMNVVDSLTIPYVLNVQGKEDATYLYGLYGRGIVLVQVATVFAASVVLPLIPSVSKRLVDHQYDKISKTIRKALTYTHLLSWPAGIGLLVLSVPLNIALFTNSEQSGVLAVIVISSIFMSFSILGTGILQGLGKPWIASIIVFGAALLKTGLNIIGVYSIGLLGAALATLVLFMLLHVANRIVIQRTITVPSTGDGWKAVISSIMMGALIGLPLLWVNVYEWSRLESMLYSTGAIFIGAVVYAALLVLFKVKEIQPYLAKWKRR